MGLGSYLPLVLLASAYIQAAQRECLPSLPERQRAELFLDFLNPTVPCQGRNLLTLACWGDTAAGDILCDIALVILSFSHSEYFQILPVNPEAPVSPHKHQEAWCRAQKSGFVGRSYPDITEVPWAEVVSQNQGWLLGL